MTPVLKYVIDRAIALPPDPNVEARRVALELIQAGERPKEIARLRHLKLLDELAVFGARVLAAAIRMHQKPWSRPTPPVSHLQRIADEL